LLSRTSYPNWRTAVIRECSPCDRGFSYQMKHGCANYTATQFFPDVRLGESREGMRREDLERQTFASEVFDLVITQDVFEHLFDPPSAQREIWHTLKPGGLHILTTPVIKGRTHSERRAMRLPDGSIRCIGPPEYHGNPIGDGALVTFYYGQDLFDSLANWAPFDVEVRSFNDRTRAILGDMTEVIICRKRDE
jgi:SAM-dependent methyltransferase